MKYPLDNEFFRNRFENACTKYKDEGALVRLERIPPPRSGNQNRYLWALYGILAEKTGYDKDDVHYIFKEKYGIKREKTSKQGKVNNITVSTKDYTTEEMSKYIDRLREIGEWLGCYMPTAQEYEKNWKEIEGQNQ